MDPALKLDHNLELELKVSGPYQAAYLLSLGCDLRSVETSNRPGFYVFTIVGPREMYAWSEQWISSPNISMDVRDYATAIKRVFNALKQIKRQPFVR